MSHPVILAASAGVTARGIAFWLLAILSVAAGLGMVLARRAVHCAVLLAVVMLSLAVFYAMLGGPAPCRGPPPPRGWPAARTRCRGR